MSGAGTRPRRRRSPGEYGAKAYGDADALISDVDAVAIALPPSVQAPLALRAARAGKHLLLDKPVAFEPAVADEIAAAVADRNLASVVFFTRRFMPELQQFINAAIETGGWVEARIDHVGTIYDEGNPFGASPWRRESGGLWDVGPHAVALVLPVLGPVTEVAAMTAPRDMTHLLLRHASGAVSKITLSVDVPPAAAREEALFAGEAGIRTVPAVPWQPIAAYGHALDQLIAAAAGELAIGPGHPVRRRGDVDPGRRRGGGQDRPYGGRHRVSRHLHISGWFSMVPTPVMCPPAISPSSL